MTFISPRAAGLSTMLADIHRAAVSDMAGRPERVAAAIRAHLHEPNLLAGISCPSCPNGYTRHLLHADPEGAYAVVALIWRPGQMSPVHAHRTWCALGVYRGVLSEAFYDLEEGNSAPRQSGLAVRECGSTSCGAAGFGAIHRLANLSAEEAVSLHVYGARFDRFGQDVNHVF